MECESLLGAEAKAETCLVLLEEELDIAGVEEEHDEELARLNAEIREKQLLLHQKINQDHVLQINNLESTIQALQRQCMSMEMTQSTDKRQLELEINTLEPYIAKAVATHRNEMERAQVTHEMEASQLREQAEKIRCELRDVTAASAQTDIHLASLEEKSRKDEESKTMSVLEKALDELKQTAERFCWQYEREREDITSANEVRERDAREALDAASKNLSDQEQKLSRQVDEQEEERMQLERQLDEIEQQKSLEGVELDMQKQIAALKMDFVKHGDTEEQGLEEFRKANQGKICQHHERIIEQKNNFFSDQQILDNKLLDIMARCDKLDKDKTSDEPDKRLEAMAIFYQDKFKECESLLQDRQERHAMKVLHYSNDQRKKYLERQLDNFQDDEDYLKRCFDHRIDTLKKDIAQKDNAIETLTKHLQFGDEEHFDRLQELENGLAQEKRRKEALVKMRKNLVQDAEHEERLLAGEDEGGRNSQEQFVRTKQAELEQLKEKLAKLGAILDQKRQVEDHELEKGVAEITKAVQRIHNRIEEAKNRISEFISLGSEVEEAFKAQVQQFKGIFDDDKNISSREKQRLYRVIEQEREEAKKTRGMLNEQLNLARKARREICQARNKDVNELMTQLMEMDEKCGRVGGEDVVAELLCYLDGKVDNLVAKIRDVGRKIERVASCYNHLAEQLASQQQEQWENARAEHEEKLSLRRGSASEHATKDHRSDDLELNDQLEKVRDRKKDLLRKVKKVEQKLTEYYQVGSKGHHSHAELSATKERGRGQIKMRKNNHRNRLARSSSQSSASRIEDQEQSLHTSMTSTSTLSLSSPVLVKRDISGRDRDLLEGKKIQRHRSRQHRRTSVSSVN